MSGTALQCAGCGRPYHAAGDLGPPLAQPPRILVVDDDPDLRIVVAAMLELEGYAVSAIADGAAVLHVAVAEHPALIVLDLQMPGLSGRDVAEALKQGGVRIPLLALTAEPDAQAAAEEIGAADWLAKPFELADLLAKVGRLCPPA